MLERILEGSLAGCKENFAVINVDELLWGCFVLVVELLCNWIVNDELNILDVQTATFRRLHKVTGNRYSLVECTCLGVTDFPVETKRGLRDAPRIVFVQSPTVCWMSFADIHVDKLELFCFNQRLHKFQQKGELDDIRGSSEATEVQQSWNITSC